MDILEFKIIAFITIFLSGLFGGYLSFRIAASKRSDRLFSYGNVFTGGIFLGAGLIHMLQDASVGFGKYDFPWAMLLCAFGFMLIMLTEKVVFRVHEKEEQLEREIQGDESQTRLSLPSMLAIILGIHSLIAGIALGAEDLIRMAFVILIVLVSHKSSAAFALGVQFQRSRIPSRRIAFTIVIFSLITPLGIVIGSILTSLMSGGNEALLEATFDALAAGTFLYVAILEVFEKEFSKPENQVVKLVLAMLGMILMALLAIWI